MSLEKDVTYLVESDHDDTVLLALDAKVQGKGVEWFDTNRDRGFMARKVEKTTDGLRFETGEAKYALRKLTLELYNRKVLMNVDGRRMFHSTEALQQFYRHYPR
jgi:hypothetical protein